MTSKMRRVDLLNYTNGDLAQRRGLATQQRYLSQTEDHRAFGYDYFDNEEGMGYGGYYYDGRYAEDVKRIIEFYGLRKGDRVLDVGCAKGFVLVEFLKQGMEVEGLDLSPFCVENCHKLVRGKVHCGRAIDTTYPDNYFDLVLSKEMLPHLEKEEAAETIELIQRWGKAALLVIQCISSEKYAERFVFWDATHKIAMLENEWELFLERCGYTGSYNLKLIL